jgi:enamine deaminase RidA (YjgF/YER057c/UK114 family)
VLFVSGTASIVGHQTLHEGNVVAQAHETLTNLQSVVAAAVSHGARDVALLSDMFLKAYLRHPDDQPLVRQVLAGHGLDADAVLYLHADICRANLLVEIEAVGPRDRCRSGQEQPIRRILGFIPVSIPECCQKTAETRAVRETVSADPPVRANNRRP